MIKTYFQLTKPGIIFGNSLAALGGFFLASTTQIDGMALLAMFCGLSLIIASACVVNNYIDRSIDQKMARTRNRALAAGKIPIRNALIFASILGISGVLFLLWGTNILTLLIALIGYFFYVVMYGIWKRRSPAGTLVGSISGATPPVVGYVAVTNTIDMGAVLLFLILVAWQMPHFYAITIYRLNDYKAAGIPTLPIVNGIHTTKIHMIGYTLAFIITSALLTVFGYTGYIYLGVMVILGIMWLRIGFLGFKTDNDIGWSRKNFKFSLYTLTIFCVLISLEVLLP